jgi:hypothetical protein
VRPGTEVVVEPSGDVVVVPSTAVVDGVVDVVDGVVDVVDEESVGALALAGITEVTPTAKTVRRTVAFRVITRALIFMMHILLKRNR